MKLFLFPLMALLTIAGCSSQPELLCGGDNVKELANRLLKTKLLGNIEAVKNESSPKWEYIYPSYNVEFKNIRLISRNKELNQISCEADIESNIFDVRKLALDMVNSFQGVIAYLMKKEPNHHQATATLNGVSIQLKVIAMNHEKNEYLYPIKYEVQPTEDKKSIYLKFTSSMPVDLIETINALSVVSYDLRISEDKMKKEPLANITEIKTNLVTQEATSTFVSKVDEANASQPVFSTTEVEKAFGEQTSVRPPNVNEGAAITWSPSFDCVKVSTGPERLICGDKSLSELDVKLSLIYRQTLEKVSDKEALRASQRNWRKFQRDACVDMACISGSYRSRIDEIGAMTL